MPNEPALKTIASHSGSHHADDVVGVAILQRLFPHNTIIRTRDPEQLAAADFVIDVSGEYDPSRGRFDHHQKGFSVKRDSGVGYASAGLVWLTHGKAFVERLILDEYPMSATQVQAVVQRVDDSLMQHLDRADTGEAVGAPGDFGLSVLLSQYNVTWMESRVNSHSGIEALQLEAFKKAVSCALELIEGSVYDKMAEVLAEDIVRSSPRLVDEPRILILDDGSIPWTKVVIEEMPDVLFVLYPNSVKDQYQVRTVPVELNSFKARADLPAAWAGLRDNALADLTGVHDAAFCHSGLFIGGAATLLGAAELALLALANLDN